MSKLTKSGFDTTYVNASGTFATNGTRNITATNMRTFADDIVDSSLFIEDSHDTIQYILNPGATITTGIKGDIMIPFDCTVIGWDISADTTGSIVIDIWKDTFANYPPTIADTITGSEKPTLSSALINQDLTLTTWTTDLTRGDWLRFNVDSVSTVSRVTIVIRVKRTS